MRYMGRQKKYASIRILTISIPSQRSYIFGQSTTNCFQGTVPGHWTPITITDATAHAAVSAYPTRVTIKWFRWLERRSNKAKEAVFEKANATM